MALFNGYYRNGSTVEPGDASYNGMVIGKAAVAVKLNKAFEYVLYIVHSRGTSAVTGKFYSIIGYVHTLIPPL